MGPVSAGTRVDRRKVRTRAAILEAAEKVFTRGGYRGARVEDIAESADVSVGSLYTHFGNKDGLYLALVEWAAELFSRYLQQAYRAEWSPLEQVMACGDAYLRFHCEHPGAFRFLAFDGVENRPPDVDPAGQERVGERVAGILQGFQDKIQQAVESGEIDPRLDAKLVARFLWGAWNGTVALGLRTDSSALDDTEIRSCLEQARVFVVKGLASPASTAPDGRPIARLLHVDSPPDVP